MSVNSIALQALYVAYFSRPADKTGLAYWEAALTSGTATLAQIAAAFANSAEYEAEYQSLGNDQKVAKVYQNLFGRQPEPAGLQFWSLALTNGTITFDNMVTMIASGAQGSDLVAYNNKTAAADAFTVELNTTAEILAYSGAAANVMGKEFIASVTDTPSLTAATAPAALNATIAEIVAESDPATAAVLTTKASYDTAAAATVIALATASTEAGQATTAAAAVTNALTLQAAADLAAAATNAATLQVTLDEKIALSEAAVEGQATAQANVDAKTIALQDAIAGGDGQAVSIANGNLIIAQSQLSAATLLVAPAAAAVVQAEANYDAAVNLDDLAATAAANVTTAVTAATTASAEATAAATAASASAAITANAAAAYAAATAATIDGSDNAAGNAAVTAAAVQTAAAVTAATNAATAAAVVQAVLNDVLGTAQFASALIAYNTANTNADAAAAAAVEAATAADAGRLAATSLTLANTAIDLAAAEVIAAAAATATANIAVSAAAALVTASNLTSTGTDDVTADAAAADAALLVSAAATATADAAADVLAAAGLPALFTPTTITLTAGIDTFVGGKGNDTITGSTAAGAFALTAFDNIDGGEGAGDVFNANSILALDTTVPGATVKNVEVVNLTGLAGVTTNVTTWGTTSLNVTNSTAGAIVATAAATTNVVAGNSATAAVTVNGGKDVTISGTGALLTATGAAGAVAVSGTAMAAANVVVDGGTSVAVTTTGVTTGAVTIGGTTAPSGAVVVNVGSSAAATQGLIEVTGGTTVSVTTAGTNAVNTMVDQADVDVYGTADVTTSVTVSQTKAAAASGTVSGRTTGDVMIQDGNFADDTADTIATVSLTNVNDATVDSTALSTLNLSGTINSVTLDQSNTDDDADALALTVAVTGASTIGIISGSQADVYESIAISATAATTIADLQVAAAETLAITGAGKVTFTANTDIAAVTAITVADGGSSFGTLLGDAVSFTAGAGNDTVTIGATTKAINLGAGTNQATVTVALGTGGSLTSGAGTTDVLVMTEALANTLDASAAFMTAATGFERLSLNTVTGSLTVDAAALGNFNYVTTTAATALTLTGLTTGATVELTAAANAVTSTLAGAATTATTDTQTIRLTNAASTAFGTVTVAQTETVNVVMNDTTIAGAVNTNSLTLVAADVKTLNISGDGLITVTNTNTGITTFDASGIVDHAAATGTGGVTWTTGVLAAANTIKGSTTGVNTIDFTASVAGATTYTGGSGADTIVFANAKNNVITLGNGTNLLNNGAAAGTGNNTVTGGTGADTVKLLSGNNVVDLGNGANTFMATSGNNTYTGGTGVDQVTVTTGGNTISTGAGNDIVTIGATLVNNSALNTVNVGTGTDTIILSAAPAGGGAYTGLTGMGAGDLINFTAVTATASVNGALGGKVVLGGASSFANFLNAAANATDAATTAAQVNWFQFGGNTFIVVDNSDLATFEEGVDSVIQLVGEVDLSTSTVTGDILTLV